MSRMGCPWACLCETVKGADDVYLNIAICEDDENDLRFLETCLHSACGELDLTARITRFFSGEDFLTTLRKKNTPRYYFHGYLHERDQRDRDRKGRRSDRTNPIHLHNKQPGACSGGFCTERRSLSSEAFDKGGGPGSAPALPPPAWRRGIEAFEDKNQSGNRSHTNGKYPVY